MPRWTVAATAAAPLLKRAGSGPWAMLLGCPSGAKCESWPRWPHRPARWLLRPRAAHLLQPSLPPLPTKFAIALLFFRSPSPEAVSWQSEEDVIESADELSGEEDGGQRGAGKAPAATSKPQRQSGRCAQNCGAH